MAQSQITQIQYIEPKIMLRTKDRIFYNPELAIINSEKVVITSVNYDSGGYSKDYIISGENIYIKTVNITKNNDSSIRTIEVEPYHSDQPAIFARVREVYGNRQKTVVMQTYLYYRGKWYVFTYSF